MLQDIFNALAGGVSQGGGQAQQQGGGGNLLSGLMGSLLGGGQGSSGSSQQMSQPQGSGLESMLGSLLGGGGAMPAGGSPLTSLINSGQNPMVNSLVQPAIDQVAAKIGIPPAAATAVVTTALHYIMANHGTKLANGEDMSGILAQHTNPDYLHSTGLTKHLAQQTGLQPNQAASALSEVFKLLGGPSTAQ